VTTAAGIRGIALLAFAAVLAGCGAHDRAPATATWDAAAYGPRHAVPGATPRPRIPQARPASPRVARQLASGAVGVVDVGGTVGVRPRVLETADDATLSDLRWTRWDASGARGSGRLRLLDCQPSCAGGGSRSVAARITLSRVRSCGGRDYFDAATVSVAAGPQPASYVRAPC